MVLSLTVKLESDLIPRSWMLFKLVYKVLGGAYS